MTRKTPTSPTLPGFGTRRSLEARVGPPYGYAHLPVLAPLRRVVWNPGHPRHRAVLLALRREPDVGGLGLRAALWDDGDPFLLDEAFRFAHRRPSSCLDDDGDPLPRPVETVKTGDLL